MQYTETQCADPWAAIGKDDTRDNVIAYLSERDIKVHDFQAVRYHEGAVCLACTCISGRYIRVLVDRSDKEVMITLGFVD